MSSKIFSGQINLIANDKQEIIFPRNVPIKNLQISISIDAWQGLPGKVIIHLEGKHNNSIVDKEVHFTKKNNHETFSVDSTEFMGSNLENVYSRLTLKCSLDLTLFLDIIDNDEPEFLNL